MHQPNAPTIIFFAKRNQPLVVYDSTQHKTVVYVQTVETAPWHI